MKKRLILLSTLAVLTLAGCNKHKDNSTVENPEDINIVFKGEERGYKASPDDTFNGLASGGVAVIESTDANGNPYKAKIDINTSKALKGKKAKWQDTKGVSGTIPAYTFENGQLIYSHSVPMNELPEGTTYIIVPKAKEIK